MSVEKIYVSELTFIDIFNLCRTHIKILLLIPSAIAFITFTVAYFFIQPCYEAKGIIEIGSFNNKLLESPKSLENRLNQSSFIYNVMERYPKFFSKDKREIDDRKSQLITAKSDKESDLIFFTIVAKSYNDAQARADAVMDMLSSIHAQKIDNHVKNIKQQIELIDTEIESVQMAEDKLSSAKKNHKTTDLEVLLMPKYMTLMSHKLQLQEILNSGVNTRLMDRVHISFKPATPNLLALTLVVFFFVLFGTISIFIFYEHLKRCYRSMKNTD